MSSEPNEAPITNKKYVVVPERITSRIDGQSHFVNFDSLCKLWGVNPDDCIHYRTGKGVRAPGFFGLPVLRPRADGKYVLKDVTNG